MGQTLDKKIFNQIVKDYTSHLLRYVNKSVRDKDVSKDLVQDCFIKLWENKEKIDVPRVKFWLFRTVTNLMINHIKKNGRYRTIEDNDAPIDWNNNHKSFELKELIDKSLDQLPDIQKSIITLRDFEGYDYKEIGDILSLSESQVKVYLFRGRQKIKNLLKEQEVFQSQYN